MSIFEDYWKSFLGSQKTAVFPGETIAFGAPTTCSDCGVNTLDRLHVGSGNAISTSCNCGPGYSRESEYIQDPAKADQILAQIKDEMGTTEDTNEKIAILKRVMEDHGIAR